MKTYFRWIESVFATVTDHTCSNIISRDLLFTVLVDIYISKCLFKSKIQIFSEFSTVLLQDQEFQVIYPGEEIEFLNKEAVVPRTNSHQYHGCVELKATSQDTSYVLEAKLQRQICNCRVTNGRCAADRFGSIKTNLTFHTKRAGRIYRFGILYSACIPRKLPVSCLFSEDQAPLI
jgi:hypothetical protein